MQLSCGVWDSSFKHSPTVCAKTVSSLLKEAGFFPNDVNTNVHSSKLLWDNFT